MRRAFDRAVKFTLDQEGGFVSDPRDPGGATAWGISSRRYPDLDVSALTRAEAIEIYRRDYWQHYRCDELPPLTALAFFDWLVHSQAQTVVHALQKAVSTRTHPLRLDGLIGPKTVTAVCAFARSNALDRELALTLTERRLLFLARLVQRAPERRMSFLRGWMRRCFWLSVAILDGQRECEGW